MCVCVCYWPPVREVCPNYEVAMFQPSKLTTPDLGFVAYFFTAYLLNPTQPLFLLFNVYPGGGSPLLSRFPGHRRPSCRRTGSPAHLGVTRLRPSILKTITHLPLTCHFQSPTPPLLPCLCHVCRIPVAADPLLPPEYLLTLPSAVVHIPPATTTPPR